MPFRKISRNVKLAAIQLHQCDLLPLCDIFECCGFSERTWFHILKLWRETGDVINRQPSRVLRGRLCTLDHKDIDCLLRLVRQNPDYFLDEFMHMLKTNQFISVHFTTIFCELERIGLSYKKLKQIVKECNKTLHAELIAHMAQYDPSELGFIDETSKDEWTPALLTLDGIITATVVEGSMTQELFLDWLENIVCPCDGQREDTSRC
ncbi:hypothetical protein K503DRAFT_841438 [Rhizopogon vinicolor AM-OR11-026]|uniref:Uncharacterized protein n=1 Tax=Rhizopogon vinicolor AM-OR11-026 TaxID=1314800 RepID=A0A1B7N7F1_9AGAM|nr:hypothetical protein K503DRAFT_841438 [Rhizopogon vinicolor AM-OR11-026]